MGFSRRVALGLPVILSTFAPMAAHACDLTFLQPAQSVNLTATEVGPSARVEQDETLTFINASQESCPAYIRVSRLSRTSVEDTLDIMLSSGGTSIEILPTEIGSGLIGSDLFVGAIPGGGTDRRVVPIRLEADVPWGVGSGSSSESYRVQLLDETGTVRDSMDLSVNLEVLPSVELRIVGATGTDRVARIDLGTLNPQAVNRSDPFGIRVWSTSPYTVSFASDNVGSLAHDIGSDRIPYRMNSAGQDIELAGGSPSLIGARTGAIGTMHPIEITVQPFQAQAGRYSDRVLVTVSAT